MKNLKIYYISESYINYLRQFDKNVAYNKNTTRPYIGIVYTYNNYNYFAPLASPKPKHININPKAIDIYKIKDGELGVVNINNMIPTPIEELTRFRRKKLGTYELKKSTIKTVCEVMKSLNIKNLILFHTEDTHKDKIQLYSKDKLLL